MPSQHSMRSPIESPIHNIKVFFHHHSVGENIIGQWTEDHVDGGAKGLGFPFSVANSAADYSANVRLGENTGGENGRPATKLSSFVDFINNQVGNAIQVAVFKLCFLDFTKDPQNLPSDRLSMANIAEFENTYRSAMAGIQASHPNLRIIHVTPPILNRWNADGNDSREEMARFLRAEYGSSGFVFDLQDIESHEVNDTACTYNGAPVACESSTGGTGHLTGLASDRAAKGLLYTVLQAASAP